MVLSKAEFNNSTIKINSKGIKRIIKAFFYSAQGFKAAFISEPAFRQEVFLTIILSPIAFYFSDSVKEFIFLEIPLLFILIVELLNSALERTIDLTYPKQHEFAAKAKDYGSAAVFLSFCIAGLIWVCVLLL